jgi:hypothetical protein
LQGNIVPCDSAVTTPFATLLNGPGEFAGAIGPSGSKKAPVVRAMWQGNVDFQGYDQSAIASMAVGQYLFCGTTTGTGKYTIAANAAVDAHPPVAAYKVPVGICTHVPTAAEPWLGVASLL